MYLPDENLGGYQRGLNATLVACHFSVSETSEHFQCTLDRSRGVAMELWSVELWSTQQPTSEGNDAILSATQIGIIYRKLSCL